MDSFRFSTLDKKRNQLTVVFTLEEGKRTVRFDANHLPEDKEGLNQYMKNWIKAYKAGKQAVAAG